MTLDPDTRQLVERVDLTKALHVAGRLEDDEIAPRPAIRDGAVTPTLTETA